ncbi:MAG: PKD domain-containing protein [Phaeodactylibacter sp.]|nr:PKD domain-containing protein [Phaeodactylibacter sp.]
MRKALLSIFSLLPTLILGQITFIDASSELDFNTLRSGAPVGVVDMNNDGLDDIVRLDDRRFLYIEYQQADTSAFVGAFIADLNGINWSLCVADVDQNGYNDIFTGGQYNSLYLVKANADGATYTVSTINDPSIFLQGSNFVDINNDGAIDIFACHDDGLSVPFRNNGSGSFAADYGLIMAVSTVPSDNSGNYGSVWTDYDNDGDIDLYISKCRLGVDDPTDGRRLNLLFQNDGDNHFTEVAAQANIQPFAQSWASDFGDVDNDGDLDCFIINHDINNVLFRNNGNGTFTDYSFPSGLITAFQGVGTGLQAKFADFDNDGFIDLLYTTISGSHVLLRNNGNGTFSKVNNAFPVSGGAHLHTAAVGDLNNDGFLDVYAGFGFGYNQVSNESDRLFLNNGNGNHYFKVRLQGVNSNINGIGARLELYGSWGKQIREVRSGESYGIMNSFTGHFGLGSATSIDSLIVRWPSGNVDFWANPPADSMVFLQEGDFCLPQVSFQYTVQDLEVNFSGIGDIGISDWMWDFGDGATASGQQAMHTFPATGQYLICLSTTGNCGPSQYCQQITVDCEPPIPGFVFGSDGLDISFQDLSIGNPDSWLWDFGDGTTSTEQNPNHGFDTPGNYFVCMAITNDCGNAEVCQFVQAICNNVTTAFNFQADGLSVQFEDFSSSGTTQWMWDFGDGSTSMEQSPMHDFPATGTYEVCLSINGICGQGSSCTTVDVSCPPPVSQFLSIPDELTVQFQDNSANTPASWLWDFGDGSTANEQGPIHTFALPGTYEVCLTASSPCGVGDTICQALEVSCSPPQAGFAFTPNELTVTFTDTSTNQPSEWLWIVEGQDSTTGPSLEYTFPAPGDYEVCLQAGSICGMTEFCQSITIACAPLQAGFDFQADGLTLSFSDTSGATVTSQQWSFGDGDSGSGASPTHNYTQPGDYEICLTAFNTCGDSSQYCQTLSVSCLPPDAGFTFENSFLSVTFTDTSSGGASSWQWDFGDGSSSSNQNTQHIYSTPGMYEVCLITSSVCGADTVCQTVEIVCVEPAAGFQIQSDGLSVSITDTSQFLPTQWLWNFGDGMDANVQNPQHTFSAPGTYIICLLATNICGNDQACEQVTVSCAAPQAAFSSNANELSLSFTDQSANSPTSWMWAFGDGNVATTANPVHTYSQPGAYQVCLTASSVCGSTQSCEQVTVSCTAPQPAFSFQSDELSLSFTDNSTNSPTSWLWTFGDGSSSTVANPQHTYGSPGSYQICLEASSICGSNTSCQSIEVTCTAPQAAFSRQVNQLSVQFFDNSSPAATQWFWQFGDGATSTFANPQHTYSQPGAYTACLTVSSICGTTQTCQAISLNCPAPVASFTQTTNQLQVAFTDQSSNMPTQWLWDFGDGNTATTANPQHTYLLPGTYQVCLTSSSACGNTQFCKNLTLTCNSPQANFSVTADELALQFTDLSTNSPTSWQWAFGDGATSTEQNPAHTYNFPGNYLACLFVSSPCGNTQRCEVIEVGCTPPQAGFTFTADELAISFQDTSTTGAIAWLWDFGDGGASTQANPQHTYTMAGDYEVCLTVSNICGSTQACNTISVSCPGPVAAFNFTQDGLSINFEDQSANGPTDWLWVFGDGDTSRVANPNHDFPIEAVYEVCLYVASPCGIDSACQELEVIINETQAAGKQEIVLHTFPNPSSGRLWAELDAPGRRAYHWVLFNNLGQIIQQGEGYTNERLELDLEAEETGLYWLKAWMEDTYWLQGVIRQ